MTDNSKILESSKDNTVLCQFVILGRPATKKTHQSAFVSKGRMIVLPSKQFKKYEKLCKEPCESVWKDLGNDPMDFGVSIVARIYLNNWSIGDHVGYLQALGDIFEKYGIISDDKFIHWADDGQHWFGGVDKENPRVDVVIKRFRHPYEEYRRSKPTKKALDKSFSEESED
jgi:hypothetical protein